jgi:hypothetical protein
VCVVRTAGVGDGSWKRVKIDFGRVQCRTSTLKL